MLHLDFSSCSNNKQAGTQKNILEHGCEKKSSANLAGLLALPCNIGEISCMPPLNEEDILLGRH